MGPLFAVAKKGDSGVAGGPMEPDGPSLAKDARHWRPRPEEVEDMEPDLCIISPA